MEYNRKTIMWDDNSEPPKNYIWAKNNKFYEYDYVTRSWVESKLISGSGSGEGTNKFYIKLNRENLHLDDMNYTDFDTTIGHDLDFFFEDTDINLISKIIENIREQINNIPENLTKPGIYTDSQFIYTSNETGLVGGYWDGVYPIFNIKCDNNNKLIIKIGNTNYAEQSISSFEYLNFVQEQDGKFYYKRNIYN